MVVDNECLECTKSSAIKFFSLNIACGYCNSYKNLVNFEGKMDAFMGKIKNKQNKERELVTCAKSHDGIRK